MAENKVAIYARLSKEDFDKEEEVSESIRNQESMLKAYAVGVGWEIYDIYCDEDYSGVYSGEDNTRPDFNRMIKDASERRFDIVLCKSQSRFSRNMEVIEQYIHGKFTEWDIRFVSIADNADTYIKGNKKSRQISGLVNEWMCEDTSNNIRAVFDHKMKRGEFLASFPPYGYSKDKNVRNHLVINPNTARIVRQIFQWHSEGWGAAKICRTLNDMGIPNPRKQQELDGLRKSFMYSRDETGQWSTTSIGDILHNRAYCGDVVQHTKQKVSYKSKKIKKIPVEEQIIVPDMHEPIVSRKLFESVQEQCAKRRKATGTGKIHILSGKVFCHYCGKPMQKNHSKGNIEYLRCRDKYAYSSDRRCPTPGIRLDAVLEAISIKLIEKYKKTAAENADEEFINQLLKPNSGEHTLLESELKRLETETEKINIQKKNLYLDKLSEDITPEQFRELNRELSIRNEEISKRIDKIKKQFNTEDNSVKKLENIEKELSEFFEKKNVDRKIIDCLIDRIEFGEFNEETQKTMLKIFWALPEVVL